MNFSIVSRKHDFRPRGPPSISLEMYVSDFQMRVSAEIDMDLFMKLDSKQAANTFIYHTVPHSRVIWSNHFSQLSSSLQKVNIAVIPPWGPRLFSRAHMFTQHAAAALLVLITLLTHRDPGRHPTRTLSDLRKALRGVFLFSFHRLLKAVIQQRPWFYLTFNFTFFSPRGVLTFKFSFGIFEVAQKERGDRITCLLVCVECTLHSFG